MASIAFDEPYETDTARPPISLHPAFPAIVALWFAALLGLGSLVLPVVLLERAVEATGLAALVPAAAPPLGFTARGLVAIIGALAGAGIGIAIARRVAQAHRPQPASRVAKLSAGARAPISIKDEVGGQGVVNGESLPINRRRALAISEDDRPSDFLYQAPLPGGPEPLELSDLAEDAPPPATSDATPQTADEDIEMTENREFQPASPVQPAEAPERKLSQKGQFGQRGVEPLPFSAPSLARRGAEPELDRDPEPASEIEATASESEFPLAAVADSAPSTDEPLRADWETAPLDGLGLVQLVQRLGSTIHRRRELMAQSAPAPLAAPFASTSADIEAAPAEEAAQAMAAYFGAARPAGEAAPEAAAAVSADEPAPFATARPGFLQPFSTHDDEDEGDDPVPDFSLPLRRAGASAPSFADNDGGDQSDEADGYSSLVGMSHPFAASKAEFVRIEEPELMPGSAEPAVVFPSQQEPSARPFDPPGMVPASAAPIPADADAALRAALATLQRMSGAA